jgi:NADPH:quinone reductase-like Zn-dependent oxidoreductase
VLGGQAPVTRDEYAELLQMAAAGKLEALVDRIMPLREAAAAHRLVAENEALGKVVLDPRLD